MDRHVKQWPFRGEKVVGQKNVAQRAVVDKAKRYLSQLHIKLGLINLLATDIFSNFGTPCI